MADTIFIMICPECNKQYKVTESQGLVICKCGNTIADERYFKLNKDGELVEK